MTLTEEEAGTKWCPEFRRAGGGGNSDADGYRRTNCIGSKCMFWRWLVNEDQPDIDRTIGGILSVGYCGKAR